MTKLLLAMTLTFMAATQNSAYAQTASETASIEMTSQKIEEIKSEISSIKRQLVAAKVKKYTAVTVKVTLGVVAAVSLWSRVATLTDDGFKFFLPSQFDRGLEAAFVISGAGAVGAHYYKNLKNEEIDAFNTKLTSLEALLTATQVGLEVAK